MSDERGYIMQLGLYKIGYKFYFQVLSPYLLGHQSKYIYSLWEFFIAQNRYMWIRGLILLFHRL